MIKTEQAGFFAGAALIASILCGSPASAQDWPTRPLTMVYPFAAGSAGDAIGRPFAAGLSEILGQRVIFENVGGTGGMTGAARVAKATPDGYQFLLGGANLALNRVMHKHPLYDAMTDLVPVILLSEQPTVLIVRKDLPVNNLQEFITYANTHQERMQYGSPGAGSLTHLACTLLNAAIGVKITHVPYRGGAGALQDLIAGRIDYQCPIIWVGSSQILTNAVKPIAVLSKSRSPALPDVPSAHEQGLTDFDVSAWSGFFLPKGTPTSIVQKLQVASAAAMETPVVRDRLKQIGATLVQSERRSPGYLQEFLKTEIERWAGAAKTADIQSY